MEQLVARRAHNPKVVGSSPAPATQVKALSEKLKAFVFLNDVRININKKISLSAVMKQIVK